ncbi:protein of unknown function [Streptomyces sp. KY75]|nr:protein of unknown function [Streptomyces sp. KY70]CAD5994467.1 protein of unknown function [Streptomyces sp. KY75]
MITVARRGHFRSSLWITLLGRRKGQVRAGRKGSERFCVLRAALADGYAEVLTDPVDEQGHLVGHLPDIGFCGGQHTQAAAVARGGHEEQRLVELDHGLAGPPRPEVPPRTARQAVQTGRDRGQVLGVLAGQSRTGPGDQAVVRQHQGVPYVLHPAGEIVKEPVKSPVKRHLLVLPVPSFPVPRYARKPCAPPPSGQAPPVSRGAASRHASSGPRMGPWHIT